MFDDNIEAYEAAGMLLDLFAEMYTNLSESNHALGNQLNADDLINQIYEKLPSCEAELGKLDEFGQRYTIDIPITGPNGNTVNVRTGWIIKTDSDISNMTTIYVK